MFLWDKNIRYPVASSMCHFDIRGPGNGDYYVDPQACDSHVNFNTQTKKKL